MKPRLSPLKTSAFTGRVEIENAAEINEYFWYARCSKNEDGTWKPVQIRICRAWLYDDGTEGPGRDVSRWARVPRMKAAVSADLARKQELRAQSMKLLHMKSPAASIEAGAVAIRKESPAISPVSVAIRHAAGATVPDAIRETEKIPLTTFGKMVLAAGPALGGSPESHRPSPPQLPRAPQTMAEWAAGRIMDKGKGKGKAFRG